MRIYFDASALVKRYAQETGTPLLNEVFAHVPYARMTCSTLGILEVLSILIRKRNDGRLKHPLFEGAMNRFKTEVLANPSFLTAPVTDAIVVAAMDFIPKHHINATDAVVLRSVLTIQQALRGIDDILLLWTSDKRLYRAAHQEGIPVFDPEQETIASLRTLPGLSPHPDQ
ncbi:MAG: type II toxin-antitoxin system VapC family toxin [Chloroflexaceae bacterium]|nr:type II toxin-antitoxin system VapC family toxin [Chloroflexaceae bacterium]